MILIAMPGIKLTYFYSRSFKQKRTNLTEIQWVFFNYCVRSKANIQIKDEGEVSQFKINFYEKNIHFELASNSVNAKAFKLHYQDNFGFSLT